MSEEIMRALGKLEGKMDGIEATVSDTHKVVGKLDDRVRSIEMRSARHGAIAGGVMGIGVSLVVANIRAVMKSSGV